jgi:hypothetical protein
MTEEQYLEIERFAELEHDPKQDDGSWVLRDYAEGSLAVARLGVQISLADLYASALM